MVVKKILNNNVIISNGEEGQEIIIIGNGIGWKQKVGQDVDESKIDKVFRMDTYSSSARLKKLFLEVEIECIQASSEIIDYARENLSKELKKNIYITLTDHLDFAVERFKKGINLKSALYWEIRKIYPKEYKIGQHAIEVVYKYMKIRLPEDEAAAIAMHLVNAEYDSNMTETEAVIHIVKSATAIVEKNFETQLDEESLDYQRFMTHLLFFAQRITEKKGLQGGYDLLLDSLQDKYSQEFECAGKIGDFIQEEYNITISKQEITFLAVHIVRVVTHKNE